jgi:hypothetical protein
MNKRDLLLHKSTGVYIGRLECGCVMALTSDYGDKGTANNVREFIMDGMTVTRVSWEEYRESVSNEIGFLDCPHEKERKDKIQAQLTLFGLNKEVSNES